MICRTSHLSIEHVGRALGLALLVAASAATAAPSAEVAKRCIRYAYVAYPFKRPGSVPMSGDRQAYIKDCMGKNGDVPAPQAVMRSPL
jgi:hypothetical protein